MVLKQWPIGRFKKLEAIHTVDGSFDRLTLKTTTEAGTSFEISLHHNQAVDLIEVIADFRRRAAERKEATTMHTPGKPLGCKRVAP